MTINTQTIPFVDLTLASDVAEEINAAIKRVLVSGNFIQGDEVSKFEQEYALYTQAKYCVGVASGLDALHLTLRAMGVGSGDEVIVPSHTYIATWLAVGHCGAKVVPVEPVENSYVIDPHQIESAITKKTKVIIPVHMYGMPADLDSIIEIARGYNIKVLEDAAQCHGAYYKNRRIGSHGDAVAWSFYPTKNLGAMGDGGAVTCNDPVLAERIRCLGNYGSREKNIHELKGFNSRLDPMQAAILSVKLKYLDHWNNNRKVLAHRYLEGLKNTSFILPNSSSGFDHVWHLYVIRHQKRDELVKWLSERNIKSQVHYPTPPHRQQVYAEPKEVFGAFSVAEHFSKEVISLPMWPHLDFSTQDKVIIALRQFSEMNKK